MFWRKSKGKTAESEAFARGRYERLVDKVYSRGQFSLALAHLAFGHQLSTEDEHNPTFEEFKARGVVHEDGAFDRRVFASVEFVDELFGSEGVGRCHLTHFEPYTADAKRPRWLRPLMLKCFALDSNRSTRNHLVESIRNAALSGHQFLHMHFRTDATDPAFAAGALKKLDAEGYGPSISITSISVWNSVRLPAAPAWAWTDPYEQDL